MSENVAIALLLALLLLRVGACMLGNGTVGGLL